MTEELTTPVPALADGSTMVRLQELSTRFGRETVLSGVSFDVRAGEFACVLGPSGCGKSTILRILGNLLTHYDGTVTVAGQPPARSWSRLAYVFQAPRLVPWRTAIMNVRLGPDLRYGRSRDPRERRERAARALEMVGLGSDAEKYPAVMSGGERQRVALARALAVDPDVILMDEPLSALDAYTKRWLRDEIIRVWRDTGKTIIFVTHDVDEALYLADRVIVLSRKPTRVVQNLVLNKPRPRNTEDDQLRSLRSMILSELSGGSRPVRDLSAEVQR